MNHGLNESEAKTYLALLGEPHMGASALAKTTGVPRNHVYTVLDGLHGRGLVDIVLDGRSRVYRARPFSEFLGQRAHELRQDIVELELEAKTLGNIMRPPPEATRGGSPAGAARLIFGRKMVAHEVDALLSSASEEVVIASRCESAGRIARHLGRSVGSREGMENPPRVTVILPAGPSPGELAGLHGSVHIRRIEGGPAFLAFIADKEKLLMIHPIPDGGDVREGRDVALFSDDPIFACGVKELLIAASRPQVNGAE